MVLGVSTVESAKPEKPGIRRLTKYTCEVNIGQVRECKSKGLNAEVEVKEVTNQSTLIISAEFRNSGPLVCASISTTLRFDVELIGPVEFQRGAKETYASRIDFNTIEPSEQVSGTVTISFTEC